MTLQDLKNELNDLLFQQEQLEKQLIKIDEDNALRLEKALEKSRDGSFVSRPGNRTNIHQKVQREINVAKIPIKNKLHNLTNDRIDPLRIKIERMQQEEDQRLLMASLQRGQAQNQVIFANQDQGIIPNTQSSIFSNPLVLVGIVSAVGLMFLGGKK